jgi:hypothetical protein
MTEETKTAQFRIDGVYRQKGGDLVRLDWCVTHFGRFAQAVFINRSGTDGERDLATGKYPYAEDDTSHKCHLLPGELHQVNGQWVPVEDSGGGSGCITKTPTLDKLENTSEPKHPRLTWADSKRVDRFPGYHVRSNHVWLQGEEDADHPSPFGAFRSPDLAPSSPQVLPVFGSAKLVG